MSLEMQFNKISLSTISRHTISFMALTMMVLQAYAQSNSKSYIPDDLLTNKTPVDEILFYEHNYNGALYWPNDMILSKFGDLERMQHLVTAGGALYYTIDGTGRVYRVDDDGQFIRMDSTVFEGYNFEAYVFSYRDTSYSLGGNGFWHQSGQLRFFHPVLREWEFVRLNKQLPINAAMPLATFLLWMDKKNGQLIYPDRALSRKNGFLYFSPELTDTTKVWALNLNTKTWNILGTLTKKTAALASHNHRYISLPWGELFASSSGKSSTGLLDFYLLDYNSNQVRELTPEKSLLIHNFMNTATKDNSRIFIYTRDSTLTFHVSEQQKLILQLTKTDFKAIGSAVFVPYKKPLSLAGIQGAPLGVFICGVLLFTASLWLFFMSYRINGTPKNDYSLRYDPKEVELIRAMINHAQHMLSADEVNEILETSKKSLDVQRKNRSEIIISINNKYRTTTGHAGSLITKVRAEYDKRLVSYSISPEKFDQIKEALSQSSDLNP